MPLPTLTPGLIVRYEYVWKRRAVTGDEAADKDHPACIVATFRREGRAEDYVVYLPISHSAPRDGETGLEIPRGVRRAAGLDDAPQWVLVSECNIDAWPLDLRSLPRRPGIYQYGHLPPAFFNLVRDRFVALYRERTVGVVDRDGG